jgi:putative ABC transport system substrate-binding protein
VDELRELGYADGRNLAIEWRFAGGSFDRLALLAGELVKAQAEVIVTSGTAATGAARRASATVPIVAVTFGDPVASGFAESLARPGRNVTGFTATGSAAYEKRLELLIEALPGAKKIGMLGNPNRNFFLQVLPGLEAAAKKLGLELAVVNVRNQRDLVEGFSNLATRRVDAVLIGDDGLSKAQVAAIAGLALKHKMAAIFPVLRGAEHGGLIGLASNRQYRYQRAAHYVHRILGGEKPGDLPIGPPVKLDLAVNQKTAAALGITLPPAIVARAVKVIE